MTSPLDAHLRQQLQTRRSRLRRAAAASGGDDAVRRLLRQVDAALSRMDQGTFGLCAACGEPVEPERLLADPLLEYCLDHLTPGQARALEEDLELATKIQAALLPQRKLRAGGWEISYHYQGFGPTSGDHCDLLPGEDGGIHFIIGDVAGKGLAASLLMAHLHATFRALAPLGLALPQMVARASRAFCESTLPDHYATLVCGFAQPDGHVMLCNAGHPPPLLAPAAAGAADAVAIIEAVGLPLGMFCEGEYRPASFVMSPGEALFLYTDGLTEAVDPAGRRYGAERARRMLARGLGLPAERLLAAALADWEEFRAGAPRQDDLTLMAVRRC